MATAFIAWNSGVSGAFANSPPSAARKHRVTRTVTHEEGFDMAATDKLVEKNCLLAELRRLAAKKL